MRSKEDRIAAAFALALCLLAGWAALRPFAEACGEVRANTLRLHIVAASDSAEDQRRKLLVRDAILEEYGPALAAGDSIGDALAVTGRLTGSIEESARHILQENGSTDPVRAEVVEMYFDTIAYENGVQMPAGRYKALRLVIGAGEGRNWWCVMYPPLCLPAASPDRGTDAARIAALNGEEGLVPKLAAVELVERVKDRLGAAKNGLP